MPTYTVLRSFPVILIWSLIAQQLRNLKDKTMAYKCMYITREKTKKITTSLDQNQGLKRLDTQLNEPTNQNSIKVPIVVKKTQLYTTLKIRVINNTMSSPSLTAATQ